MKALIEALGEGPITASELLAKTGIARRTLYRYLSRYSQSGRVKTQVSLRDSRKTHYWLSDEEYT